MLLLLLWMFLCRYFPGNAAHLLCNGPWQQVMVFLARPSRRLIESLLLNVFSLPSLLPFLLPSFLSSVNEMTVSPSPHTHTRSLYPHTCCFKIIRDVSDTRSHFRRPLGRMAACMCVCVCVCVCVSGVCTMVLAWGVGDMTDVRLVGW